MKKVVLAVALASLALTACSGGGHSKPKAGSAVKVALPKSCKVDIVTYGRKDSTNMPSDIAVPSIGRSVQLNPKSGKVNAQYSVTPVTTADVTCYQDEVKALGYVVHTATQAPVPKVTPKKGAKSTPAPSPAPAIQNLTFTVTPNPKSAGVKNSRTQIVATYIPKSSELTLLFLNAS